VSGFSRTFQWSAWRRTLHRLRIVQRSVADGRCLL